MAPGIFHVLSPAPSPSEALDSLSETERNMRELAILGEELEGGDVPDDCTAECWRNVPGSSLPCTCGGDEDGTTAAPGGW